MTNAESQPGGAEQKVDVKSRSEYCPWSLGRLDRSAMVAISGSAFPRDPRLTRACRGERTRTGHRMTPPALQNLECSAAGAGGGCPPRSSLRVERWPRGNISAPPRNSPLFLCPVVRREAIASYPAFLVTAVIGAVAWSRRSLFGLHALALIRHRFRRLTRRVPDGR
jgi:hypothetical protein